LERQEVVILVHNEDPTLEKGVGKNIACYCLVLYTLVGSILQIRDGMVDLFPTVVQAINRRTSKKYLTMC